VISTVSAKYAFRSLLRHRMRTFLSMVGVGIGCAMGVVATSWIRGAVEMEVRAVAESGTGHLRVVPAKWIENRENTLRLSDPERTLEIVRQLPGLRTAAPRARTSALLAFGTRTSGVEMMGVDPPAEAASNRTVQKARIYGRYLLPEDSGSVVIGKTIADRLKVEVGDDLYVTLAGRDEIKSAMLRIVGILETGSRDIDEAICHVNLPEVGILTGYEGPGEITVLLDDYRLVDSAVTELRGRLPAGNTAVSWQEVNPGWAAGIEGDKAFMSVLIGIVVVVVALGIASAHVTGVLERRREFAILCALGMRGRHLAGLIVLEAILVGVGGALMAMLLGGSAAYWLSSAGVNFAAFMGEDVSFGDILLDPYLYGAFGLWVVWYAVGVSVIATLFASVYPAWLATRVNPADALRTV